MELFEYKADVLPVITLMGYNTVATMQKNIRRVSEDYIFYIVTDGEMFFNENGKNYSLKKGECFLFEPNMLHFGTEDSIYNYIYIHFKHPFLKKRNLTEDEWSSASSAKRNEWFKSGDNGPYPYDNIILPKFASFEDVRSFNCIVSKMEKALEKRRIHLENYNTACACAVTEAFIELYRRLVFIKIQHSESPEVINRINEVIEYINANYKDKITGEIIEKELSYNFDYLNQIFKRHLNTSIFKYLTSVRIQEAKDLLQSSDFTVKEISRRVGYEDDTYFFKVFKKQTGYSPKEYRNYRS